MFVKLVSNVKEPLLINVPAVAAVYQSIVSTIPGVATIVIFPGPHLDALTATGAPGNKMLAVTFKLAVDEQPFEPVTVTV